MSSISMAGSARRRCKACTARLGGPTTIGVTFWRSIGGTILEADIALNPAFSFTLDDEWIYDGSTAQGFRLVMLHELGHMLGLDHEFNGMAIMNYFPSVFRFFAMPYGDDAQALRVVHPSRAIARNDLGVALYYASGYQSASDASYPGTATAGGNLTVNYYLLQNVRYHDRRSADSPVVSHDGAQLQRRESLLLAGTLTYPALAPFSRFTESTVARTFTIPTYLPGGSYYLAAFIPGDDGASQGSFPFSNNFAFSRLRILVNAAPPAPSGLVAKSAGYTQVRLTWAPVAAATSYTVKRNSLSGRETVLSAGVTGSSYADATVTKGNRYFYVVSAVNAVGESANSAEVSVILPDR